MRQRHAQLSLIRQTVTRNDIYDAVTYTKGDGEVDITEFDITESDVTFFQEIDITESDVTKKGN